LFGGKHLFGVIERAERDVEVAHALDGLECQRRAALLAEAAPDEI
jgi:hypothetical protein